MNNEQPPPMKLAYCVLIAFAVTVLIWTAYGVYHVYWGALSY